MGKYSTFLFASPSIWEGLGRLVDFGNALNVYNTSPSPEAADARALEMDWRAVGADLKSAIAAEASGGAHGEPGQE